MSLDHLQAALGRRKCAAFDCDNAARPNGWFCSDACRARTWKDRHPEYRDPPGPAARQNAAERLSTRVSNGGLQVALGRAVSALAGPPLFVPPKVAERVLVGALSERQRARWERAA